MRKWTMPWRNWPKLSVWAFKTLLLLFGLGYSHFSGAQFVQKHTIDPSSDPVALKSTAIITAVAIIQDDAVESSKVITVDGVKYELELDIHAPRPTYFLSLPVPTNSINIPQIQSKIELFTIHSGTPPKLSDRSKNDTHCTEVNAIPQSEWRAGLPAPGPSPAFHTVTHHIVHHTAGSNSNTNYMQVVRDIYLFHTEVNGWDDIGYNFVIAQDGTLFEGRDPGENGSEFEVRGAHFCAKNTGTFGVALLGNYQTAQLTEETRETLVNLLGFSLSGLAIHPLSRAVHRGVELDAISGHRDGCSTLCPGTNVYQLLPEIRLEVLESLQHCSETLRLSYASTSVTIGPGESVTFENTSTGYESYRWKFAGGSPELSDDESPEITYQRTGLYSVILYGQLGSQIDSLVVMDNIQVEGENPEPKAYPNPLSSGAPFQIEFFEDIESVYIYSLSGKLAAQFTPEDNKAYQAPPSPGFYTIIVETASESFAQKLVVR